MIGIYKITNNINGKIYIGQSIDIKKRWETHKYYTYKKDTKLQKAFTKYGISNFTFEVLEECSKELLDEKEIFWIKYFNSFEDGYNMTLGGQEGRVLDYDIILNEFFETQNLRQTALNLNISRTTVRNILNIMEIPYNKNSSVPIKVIKIDPYTLEELETYPSIVDAANSVKVSEAALRKYFKNNLKHCGGFYWKKEGEEKEFKKINKNITLKSNSPKVVYRYDKEYNFICKYKSIGEANKDIGKSRSNQSILKACQNNSIYCDCYWEIKEE